MLVTQICDEEERKEAGLMLSEYYLCVRLIHIHFLIVSQNHVSDIPCTYYSVYMHTCMEKRTLKGIIKRDHFIHLL